jgi:hypothetical protein
MSTLNDFEFFAFYAAFRDRLRSWCNRGNSQPPPTQPPNPRPELVEAALTLDPPTPRDSRAPFRPQVGPPL